MFPKNTKLYVPDDIFLSQYYKYDEYFDVSKYVLEKKYSKNLDLDLKKPIFLVDKNIEKQDFAFKIDKFKKLYPNISKMLVFNLDDISYFTNLRSYQSKYSSNFRSYLYLDFKNSNYILFSDKITNCNIDKLTYANLDDFENYVQSIKEDIYVDFEDISLKNYLLIKKPKQYKEKRVALLSSIKQLSVIEHLQIAYHKLDKAIFNFKKQLKVGLSEYDLVKIFENELIKEGAYCPSFKTILAIGENSASIHYSSYDKNKVLENESILLLDCGGYYDAGYATDITRTFYFGSRPSVIYKKVYTNVLKTFIKCFLSCEKSAKKVDKIAHDCLCNFEERGFYFSHGLGHGIGTSVHQNPPRLSMNSKDTIKPFQVHSIEPGLYGKDNQIGLEFGVRIENCVYWDINYKRHSLSKFPFEEVLIDYGMLNEIEADFVKKWQESF